MAEYWHRHWLDWAFWSLVGVYASMALVALWHPGFWVTMGLAYAAMAFTCTGFWADDIVYRRMKREQER